jgi:translation initiation factor IF-2
MKEEDVEKWEKNTERDISNVCGVRVKSGTMKKKETLMKRAVRCSAVFVIR